MAAELPLLLLLLLALLIRLPPLLLLLLLLLLLPQPHGLAGPHRQHHGVEVS